MHRPQSPLNLFGWRYLEQACPIALLPILLTELQPVCEIPSRSRAVVEVIENLPFVGN
ncbi:MULTISPECIES: hypothetical protein [unclassified Microcoleus]|uniref:hypothetical protein n=1 Tax=unclassified Microcoleus TaxID=2642155 RepID=UPI002FCED16F